MGDAARVILPHRQSVQDWGELGVTKGIHACGFSSGILTIGVQNRYIHEFVSLCRSSKTPETTASPDFLQAVPVASATHAAVVSSVDHRCACVLQPRNSQRVPQL